MKHKSFFIRIMALSLIFITSVASQPDLKSKPWNGKRQIIPGRIIAVFFDEGGEGVAFHNPAAKNNGSEGIGLARNGRYEVGMSTTKPGLDKYSDGTPLPYDKYYIGWTVPEEWLNYSVDVQNAGTYQINMLASSARNDAAVSLLINGEDRIGEIVLETTGHVHTWQLYSNLAEIKLKKGPQILTLKFVKQGLMNVQYLEFIQK